MTILFPEHVVKSCIIKQIAKAKLHASPRIIEGCLCVNIANVNSKHDNIFLDLDHSGQPLSTSSPDHAPLHRQKQDKPVYLFNSASTVVAFNAFLTVASLLLYCVEY